MKFACALWFALTLVSTTSLHAAAQQPPNPAVQKKLRAYLNLPESHSAPVALTLQDVTLAAIRHSDSFKAVFADAIKIESSRLQSQALTDTYFTASAGQQWNRNQPENPFGTVRSEAFQLDLGVEKKFSTGTKLGLGLSELHNDLVFGGNFGSTNARVATARIQLEQSLWRDFFGNQTRQQLESGELLSKSEKLKLEQNIEEWFLQLAQLYHQAWLTQRRIEATRLNVERRALLANLFKRRQALGTSEEADRIQIEAALEQNRIQLAESIRSLERIWQNLIVTLKLPDEYRSFAAMDIPLALDPAQSTESLPCKVAPKTNKNLESTRLQQQALLLSREAQLDAIKPDLKLQLGLVTNRSFLNQADQFGPRWADALSVQNPAWSVGLQLTWPIEASAQKAQAAQTYANSAKLDALASQAESQILVDFEATCAELALQGQNFKLYQNLDQALQRRMQLEDRRYRQARTSPFNVLQAGDEWYGTAIAKATSQTEWWNQRYKLDSIRGELFDRLESWVKEKTGSTLTESAREELKAL